MARKEIKYILAHDHGTSGSKAAIISTKGEVVDFEFKATKLFLYPDGGAEQDPAEWWNAILETSKKLLNKNLVSISMIK